MDCDGLATAAPRSTPAGHGENQSLARQDLQRSQDGVSADLVFVLELADGENQIMAVVSRYEHGLSREDCAPACRVDRAVWLC